jgi:hypothetical protein
MVLLNTGRADVLFPPLERSRLVAVFEGPLSRQLGGYADHIEGLLPALIGASRSEANLL